MIPSLLRPVLLAAPIAALSAAPLAAVPIFEFEISGIFNAGNVGVINGVAIDKEFVISGQTLTTGHSGVPGDVDPVLAPIDTDSLSVSYNGADMNATFYTGQATYDLLGGVFTTDPNPVFAFNETATAGVFDLKPETKFQSIVMEFMLEGATAWLGFGGEGRNLGITISQNVDGVVLFGESDWLSRTLTQGNNTRSASYTPAPIPLPAAGWLMLAGLGGLGLAARRRRA